MLQCLEQDDGGKMLKAVRSIILIAVVMIIVSCKEDLISKAKREAEKEYKPKLEALQSKINNAKRNYESTIASMNETHSSKIKSINNEHNIEIGEMQSEHIVQIEAVRQTSYNKGHSDMTERINSIYDFDVKNIPKAGGWNATVERRN
jgi:hypothetical protein